MAERSADWMAQAERDVEAAEAQRKAGFHEWACFASQQAAEKACKAVLSRRGATAWGHSVRSLLEAIGGAGGDLLGAARLLDGHYVPARYPNGWADGAPKDLFKEEDAEHAITGARGILRFCAGLLAGP